MKLMQSAPRRYRLDGPNRIRLTADMPDVESRLKALNEFLDGLKPI
jgi:transcription-repair coupling factor (superfamily II helicase)